MDGAWLARMRWRRRGAWLWPAFVASVVFDALIGHWLPPAGESQRAISAALAGLFLNLFAIVLLSRPLSALVRRRRGDLPRVVARDYAGTLAVLGISAALVLAGLIHHPTVLAHREAKRDAIVRAQAFIGDRAPDEFRRNLATVQVYAIDPGNMFRICVQGAYSQRTYCVIVKTQMPFAQSVSFAGYESNAVFSAGAQ